MGDLISRSALRQEVLDKMPQSIARGVFLAFIDDAPTAYDVEKVEEELLNKRELYRIREIESLRKGEPLNIGVNLAKQASIEDCIEVVKRGGVE